MSLADWLECLSGQQTQGSSCLHFLGANTTGARHIHPGIQAPDFFTEGTVTAESSPSPLFFENTESFGQNFKIVAIVSLFWFWFLCGSLGISAVPGWFCDSQ